MQEALLTNLKENFFLEKTEVIKKDVMLKKSYAQLNLKKQRNLYLIKETFDSNEYVCFNLETSLEES